MNLDLKCRLNKEDVPHDFDVAMILPCSETVCLKCIEKSLIIMANDGDESEIKFLECPFCSETHYFNEIIPNKLVNSLLQQATANENKQIVSSHQQQTIPQNQKLLEIAIEEFKNKLDYKNELLNKVIEFNKEDITVKVESIKCDLERFAHNMFNELSIAENTLEKILSELESNEAKSILQRDINIDEPTDSNQIQILLQKSKIEIEQLEKMKYFLNKNVKSIKFAPNEDIYPLMNYSFVGTLKLASQNIINVIKLQELKKKTFYKTTSNYSDISLNIVGLTMDINSDILISERTENRLIKLDKHANFIKGSDSFSQLSNSCGITTNCLNQIFVTDAKFNLILKFNSDFNLVQTVGSFLGSPKFGKLNYPWGITAESGANPDHFVYVCDYKNSRCIKLTYDLQPCDIYAMEKEQKPRRVQVKNDCVYLLHKTDSHIFISVFDKNSCELLRLVKQFETNVKSFFIDDLLNIFTIGQLSNSTDQTQHLNCYNKYNQLMFRTLLLTENKVWDFCFKQLEENDELRLYGASSEGLYTFEF